MMVNISPEIVSNIITALDTLNIDKTLGKQSVHDIEGIWRIINPNEIHEKMINLTGEVRDDLNRSSAKYIDIAKSIPGFSEKYAKDLSRYWESQGLAKIERMSGRVTFL